MKCNTLLCFFFKLFFSHSSLGLLYDTHISKYNMCALHSLRLSSFCKIFKYYTVLCWLHSRTDKRRRMNPFTARIYLGANDSR